MLTMRAWLRGLVSTLHISISGRVDIAGVGGVAGNLVQRVDTNVILAENFELRPSLLLRLLCTLNSVQNRVNGPWNSRYTGRGFHRGRT